MAPVTVRGKRTTLMFQESALFPWLDVMGNVLFGLKLKPNLTNAARQEVAQFYLQLVGLEQFTHASIHQLSGGMKQRVALARSLAPNPRVLLMDEPLANLDAMTREQMYSDVQQIWQKRRKTIVFVTHNVREAFVLGDRVLLLSARPGRLKKEFRCELPRPRHIEDYALVEAVREVLSDLREEVLAANQKDLDHEKLAD